MTVPGSLSIRWVGHSTVRLELDGTTLLTDPLLRRRAGPLVRIAAAPRAGVAEGVDAVLLSHLHGDHTDLPSLRMLPAATPIIAPAGSGAWLRARGLSDVHELQLHETVEVGALRVVAKLAVHDGRRAPFGPRAESIGFVVAGSRTVYFAGDTDLFPEMADLAPSIDLALLPVWGWGPNLGPGHLDPARAAAAAAVIAPGLAVPIHWGTFALPRVIRRGADPSRPAREFAALAARQVPPVRARVLAPGEQLEIEQPRG